MSDFFDGVNMDEIAGLAETVNLTAFTTLDTFSRAGNESMAMPATDDALLDRLTLLKNDMMLGGVSTALWMAIENLNPILVDNNAALNELTAMLAASANGLGRVIEVQTPVPEAKPDTDDKDQNYTAPIDATFDNMPTNFMGAFIKGVEDQTKDNATIARLHGTGVSDKDIAQMQALAAQGQVNILGTSEPMNFNALSNFSHNLQGADKAEADFSSLMEASIRANSISGEHEADIDETASDMASIDAIPTNLFDPKTHKINQARADALNNGVANIVLATDGKVGAKQIANMSGKAGPDFTNQMTSAAGFAALEPLLLTLKGVGAEGALTDLSKVFNPHEMSGHEASELKSLGISKNSLAANQTPVQWAAWFENVLGPAMAAHGYKTGAQQEIVLEHMLKGNKGLSGLMKLLDKLDELESDHQAYQKTAADKENSYDYIDAHNIPLQINALATGIEAFVQAIAKAATPNALSMLNDLTEIINELTIFVNKHPDLAESLGLLAAGGAVAGGAGKAIGFGKIVGEKSFGAYDFISKLLGFDKDASAAASAASKAVSTASTAVEDAGTAAAKASTAVEDATQAAAKAGTEAVQDVTQAAAKAGTEAVVDEAAATAGGAAVATGLGAAGGDAAGVGATVLASMGPVGWGILAALALGIGGYEGYEHRGALDKYLKNLEKYLDKHNSDGPAVAGYQQKHIIAGESRFGGHDYDADDTDDTSATVPTASPISAIAPTAPTTDATSITGQSGSPSASSTPPSSVPATPLPYGAHMALYHQLGDLSQQEDIGADYEIDPGLKGQGQSKSLSTLQDWFKNLNHPTGSYINYDVRLDMPAYAQLHDLAHYAVHGTVRAKSQRIDDDNDFDIEPVNLGIHNGVGHNKETAQPWFSKISALVKADLLSDQQAIRVHNHSNTMDYEVQPVMSRAREIDMLANAIGAVLSAQPRHHGAVPVYIINAGDLHNATAKAIANELEGVQFGPTGFDGSFSMPIPSAHW